MERWFGRVAASLVCFGGLTAGQNGPPAITTSIPPVTPERAIVKTAEDYSEEARLAELEGTVRLAGRIGDDGRPHDLKVVESLGLGLDEQALMVAAQEVYEPNLVGRPEPIRVDYHLSSKVSRWHLIHAEFQPLEGASRPTFVKAVYPNGAGILSGAAIDEGRLLGAIGRQAFATVSFTIDENGVPGNFRAEKVSETMWGQEAIFLLREWRFKPGTKDGKAVTVPATFEVAWGPLDLSPERVALIERVARIREALEPGFTARETTPEPANPFEILHAVEPSYTQEALDAKLEGVVVVSFDLVDGAPTNIHVDEGLGKGLDEKALEAVSQLRVKPILVNGVASPLHVKFRVNFKLDQKAGILRAK
jgi:TonB family protein